MIYVDNAATTWPKPEAVYTAMDTFARSSAGNPGRGGHQMAVEAERRVQGARVGLAKLVNAETADRMGATALQIGTPGESPLDEVQARELGAAIEQAIARLRPEYRSCIMLRHVEGFSYEEIAETLELPLGTVKTYIHRARNELREYLAHVRQ